MARIQIDRFRDFPFLVARPVNEDRVADTVIELTGDELADYEEVTQRFAEWQRRLADADAV